ncbi:PhoH family protein [archaeon]|nr:PhoH family protein [archaeon]
MNKDKTNDYVLTLYNPEKKSFECLKYSIGVNGRREKFDDLFKQHFYIREFFDTTPRDIGQVYYMDHLINPGISFLVVNGKAGTGKTRLSMAAALHHLIDKEKLDLRVQTDNYREKDIPFKKAYENGLLLVKPEVATTDYGFLPGDIDDKLGPFLKPFYITLRKLTEKYKVDKGLITIMEDREIIRNVATAFLRGMNIENMISVIDELQNGNRALAKLYVSRLDQGSKNIAMGDIYQIDQPNENTNPHVKINNNALTLLTEVVHQRPRPDLAVISLNKTYRLKLAEELSDRL